MALRRPTVALMLFTFDISPLCDVAQTSDCGTHCLLLFNMSPLCDVAQTSDCGTPYHLLFNISPLRGVALTPDCGMLIYLYPSRRRFRHPIGLLLFLLGFREDYRLTTFYLSCSAHLLPVCILLICSCTH